MMPQAIQWAEPHTIEAGSSPCELSTVTEQAPVICMRQTWGDTSLRCAGDECERGGATIPGILRRAAGQPRLVFLIIPETL